MKRMLIAMVVAGVIIAGGLLVLGLWAVSEAGDVSITQAEYAAVKTGMTREQVEDAVGVAPSAVDLSAGQPPLPRDATCDYFLQQDSGDTVYRVCYRHQGVIEKVAYTFEGG